MSLGVLIALFKAIKLKDTLKEDALSQRKAILAKAKLLQQINTFTIM